MFDSLDEQMKHDDAMVTSTRERFFKWGAMIVVTVVVFGGIMLVIHFME
ncbi:MAG: hypothetical protein KIT09_18320 [Bryobacteraceae bacterium]|nr:hypothetical protein [Bryobacteraceae bacterium]